MSPDPGSTSRSSLRITLVAGTGKNRAGRSSTEDVIAKANGPPSLEAIASTMVTSARSCRTCLSRSLRAVPELRTDFSDDRSCGEPAFSASRSRSTRGWQTALPATMIVPARWTATVSQTCWGSRPPRRAVITRPPTSNAPMELNRPVACISGTTGIVTGERPSSRERTARSTASARVDGSWSTPSGRKIGTASECSRSACRQITPLGLPVVPPVYMKTWSVPGRGSSGRGCVDASSSSSSGASGPGASAGASATRTSRRSDGTWSAAWPRFAASSPLKTTAAASASARREESSSWV